MTDTLSQGMNLDSLIPAPSVAGAYINREVTGFSEFDTYEAALASGHNVLISGPTGSGKTFSARAFAASKGLPFYTVALNGAMDMATLLGAWVPDPSGSLRWQDGVLTTMVREGRGVVLFDEINMGAERNLARFYDLWDSRREIVLYEHHGEVLRVAPGSDFLVMAAYNPGYRGTRELSQALPNRFAFKMHFDYDTVIEAQLVPSASLRAVTDKLRVMAREVRTPISTNMQIEFCEIAMAFTTDYAISNWNQAFPASERQAVANIMDLFRDRIAADVAEATRMLDEEEGI